MAYKYYIKRIIEEDYPNSLYAESFVQISEEDYRKLALKYAGRWCNKIEQAQQQRIA